MVVDVYWTYAYRRSCVEQIARLQREELRDVADELVHFVEHVARTAFLHRLSVNVQMEVQSLNVSQLLLFHPVTNDC